MEAAEAANEDEWDLPTPNPAWLAKHHEDVLEPELPIIDPHHHFWKIGDFAYWLPDYEADIRSGHNIIASIHMECSTKYRTSGPEELRPVGETEFIYEHTGAADGVVAAGIVAYANLRAPEQLDRVLDAHIEASHGRLCGIRDMVEVDPDPELRDARFDLPKNILDLPGLRQSVRRLGERDLVCDLWVYFHQLEKLAEVANTAPGTKIVVNHVGGVLLLKSYRGRREEVIRIWENGMRVLSACPNVYIKIGGMGMRWMGFDFHELPKPPSSQDLAAAWGPFASTVIDLFGANRCLFESNFPVDKEVCTYRTLWNAFKRMSAGYSPAERDALFRRTALDLYKIKLPSQG